MSADLLKFNPYMTEKHHAQNSFEVYASSVRNEMLQFVPQSAKRILDVGCSVGNFGALLKSERAVEVWGVDIDEQAAAIAALKLDKVACGGFDDKLNLPANSFDCIVFNDVLEHMIDPYSALVYAKELLRENGKIIASIPNVRYFNNMWLLIVHKSWDYVDTGILDKTHLRFFTVRSIRSMFENLGYTVEIIEGINPIEKFNNRQTKKFKILNSVLFGRIEDMRWLQFAIVARPNY